MDCNIIKDLIPLYIDGCCSKESENKVKEHIETCDGCKKVLEEMSTSSGMVAIPQAPIVMHRINDWKASVLQSVLLFVSFGLMTIGVALEAQTPSGLMNGFWAFNLIIPTTGFMLSLANWYFVSVYKNRKIFSNCSLIVTFAITAGAYLWSGMHYETAAPMPEALHFQGLGILLTIVSCVLSKILSNQYGKMLGKE